MNFEVISVMALAWITLVCIVYLLKKFGLKSPIITYYGVILMIREKTIIIKLLSNLVKHVRKIPEKIIAVIVIGIFITSMLLIVPIPLTIVGLDLLGVPSMIYLMVKNLGLIIKHVTNQVSAAQLLEHGFIPLEPILPGLTVSLITFTYIIVSISVGIFFHELAHGVLALRYGSKIKSCGAFSLFFIAFGGFVELDEEDLKKMRIWRRITVYSAGVFMNIIIAYLACLVVVILVNLPLSINPLGVEVVKVVNNTQINPGAVILAVNGDKVASIYDLTINLANARIINLEYVTLTVSNPTTQSIQDMIVEVPARDELVLLSLSSLYVDSIGILTNKPLYDLLFWMYNINLTLALLNALPAYPLDGGHVVNSALQVLKVNNEVRKHIMYIISVTIWLMIGLTLYYTLAFGIHVLT